MRQSWNEEGTVESFLPWLSRHPETAVQKARGVWIIQVGTIEGKFLDGRQFLRDRGKPDLINRRG
jgi:hypothetical protein